MCIFTREYYPGINLHNESMVALRGPRKGTRFSFIAKAYTNKDVVFAKKQIHHTALTLKKARRH